MPGPTTAIEIMSNAAILCGKKGFTTIDDADEFAVSLQALYDMLVPSELSKLSWKFSKKQAQISQVAGFDPDFAEYDAAYQLPADLLVITRLYPSIPYQVFSDRLYCSHAGTLKLEYSWNIPVTYWLQPFKEYMTKILASDVALSVAENPNLSQLLKQDAALARAEAMFLDGQNSPNTPIASNPWIEVRHGRSGSVGYAGRRYW